MQLLVITRKKKMALVWMRLIKEKVKSRKTEVETQRTATQTEKEEALRIEMELDPKWKVIT